MSAAITSVAPGDFATIYDLGPLYSAGATGSGQKIAIVGQSTISTTDLNNFRSAAGLPASTPTLTLIEGTAARCSGDEGESDLDVEWSGAVAKDAQIMFLFAGLGTGESCLEYRFDSVWDALEDALTGDLDARRDGHSDCAVRQHQLWLLRVGLGFRFCRALHRRRCHWYPRTVGSRRPNAGRDARLRIGRLGRRRLRRQTVIRQPR